MSRYLVVAHQTAESPELLARLRELARDEEDIEFVLLVPATRVDHLLTWTEGENAAIALERAMRAKAHFESAGLRVVGTAVGDASPAQAIRDHLGRHADFDGVVISTFPPGASRWLRMDVVSQAKRASKLPVIHVQAKPANIGAPRA